MFAAGLIRQESTFQADAVSHADAIGLMQILPKTGRLLAKQRKIRYTKIHSSIQHQHRARHALHRQLTRATGGPNTPPPRITPVNERFDGRELRRRSLDFQRRCGLHRRYTRRRRIRAARGAVRFGDVEHASSMVDVGIEECIFRVTDLALFRQQATGFRKNLHQSDGVGVGNGVGLEGGLLAIRPAANMGSKLLRSASRRIVAS